METPPENVPHFLLIGCGGAGITIIDRVGKVQISPLTTVAADRDDHALASSRADVHILLGDDLSQELQEGIPVAPAPSVIEERYGIEHLVKPGAIVFIIAGLGGRAGSGAAPFFAKIAREKGALVIAIAVFPFRIHRKTEKIADKGLHEILRYADSVIVMDNDRYRNIFPHLSPEKVYSRVNRIIVDVLHQLIESISLPYLINIDPDNFPALFRNKGLAIIMSGESTEEGDNTQAVRNCLHSPSFDIDHHGATGCIVLITAGQEFTRDNAEEILGSFTREPDPTAEIVWCSKIKKTNRGRVQIYGIMTGIQKNSCGKLIRI